MLDDHRLTRWLENRIGYGRLDAPVWFIGCDRSSPRFERPQRVSTYATISIRSPRLSWHRASLGNVMAGLFDHRCAVTRHASASTRSSSATLWIPSPLRSAGRVTLV